jgi:TetR/AcrR family transcriptional regulator, cholesterol catabolism regulator
MSRSIPRKPTGDSAATRETLLRLAARSFGTQGYSATTMRAIAEQAGIEAASIYYHFASKEELVDVVMAHGAQRIVRHVEQHLGALPAGATAEQRLRAAVRGQMSALVEYGDYALAHGRLLAQLPDKARERQIERREQHQQLWQALLQDLRAEGLIRADLDLALCRVFLLGAINSTQTWFDPRKGDLDRVADQLCAVFFEGARPAPA